MDSAPLVLLSGLLSDERVWLHQIAHLKGSVEVCPLSPDQPTPEGMVEAILDAAPPEFSLAGHSMGGWLCLEVLKAAPSRVKKLCLLNTTARADSEEKAAGRRRMIQRAEHGEFRELVLELAEKFVFNPEAKERVERMFLEAGSRRLINQQQSMLARGECLSTLSEIACPTLILCARQDRVFSLEEHEELLRGIPFSKLALIEDSGHMSPMERPQAVTALLAFWLRSF